MKKRRRTDMDSLIFLDTETTGNEPEDRLIQVAFKDENGVWYKTYKAPLPVKTGAMAVHHITNKMLELYGPFSESLERLTLEKKLAEGAIIVAHNAKFDVGMLEKEGLTIPRYICTLKVARHLDKEATIESYGLQYLRYLLGIEIEGAAHDALGDILVLEQLFKRLHQKATIEEMLEISSKPALIRRINFGKHKGKLLSEVDPSYLSWLLSEKKKEEVPDEDWIYSLNYYLNPSHD